MYHPTEIAKLSRAQVLKLLKGHAVRVKSGKGHVVHLSTEQLKKHKKATLKGADVIACSLRNYITCCIKHLIMNTIFILYEFMQLYLCCDCCDLN